MNRIFIRIVTVLLVLCLVTDTSLSVSIGGGSPPVGRTVAISQFLFTEEAIAQRLAGAFQNPFSGSAGIRFVQARPAPAGGAASQDETSKLLELLWKNVKEKQEEYSTDMSEGEILDLDRALNRFAALAQIAEAIRQQQPNRPDLIAQYNVSVLQPLFALDAHILNKLLASSHAIELKLFQKSLIRETMAAGQIEVMLKRLAGLGQRGQVVKDYEYWSNLAILVEADPSAMTQEERGNLTITGDILAVSALRKTLDSVESIQLIEALHEHPPFRSPEHPAVSLTGQPLFLFCYNMMRAARYAALQHEARWESVETFPQKTSLMLQRCDIVLAADLFLLDLLLHPRRLNYGLKIEEIWVAINVLTANLKLTESDLQEVNTSERLEHLSPVGKEWLKDLEKGRQELFRSLFGSMATDFSPARRRLGYLAAAMSYATQSRSQAPTKTERYLAPFSMAIEMELDRAFLQDLLGNLKGVKAALFSDYAPSKDSFTQFEKLVQSQLKKLVHRGILGMQPGAPSAARLEGLLRQLREYRLQGEEDLAKDTVSTVVDIVYNRGEEHGFLPPLYDRVVKELQSITLTGEAADITKKILNKRGIAKFLKAERIKFIEKGHPRLLAPWVYKFLFDNGPWGGDIWVGATEENWLQLQPTFTWMVWRFVEAVVRNTLETGRIEIVRGTDPGSSWMRGWNAASDVHSMDNGIAFPQGRTVALTSYRRGRAPDPAKEKVERHISALNSARDRLYSEGEGDDPESILNTNNYLKRKWASELNALSSRLAAMVPKGLIREAEALLPQTDDALNAWIINPLARQYFQEAYSALPPAAAEPAQDGFEIDLSERGAINYRAQFSLEKGQVLIRSLREASDEAQTRVAMTKLKGYLGEMVAIVVLAEKNLPKPVQGQTAAGQMFEQIKSDFLSLSSEAVPLLGEAERRMGFPAAADEKAHSPSKPGIFHDSDDAHRLELLLHGLNYVRDERRVNVPIVIWNVLFPLKFDEAKVIDEIERILYNRDEEQSFLADLYPLIVEELREYIDIPILKCFGWALAVQEILVAPHIEDYLKAQKEVFVRSRHARALAPWVHSFVYDRGPWRGDVLVKAEHVDIWDAAWLFDRVVEKFAVEITTIFVNTRRLELERLTTANSVWLRAKKVADDFHNAQNQKAFPNGQFVGLAFGRRGRTPDPAKEKVERYISALNSARDRLYSEGEGGDPESILSTNNYLKRKWASELNALSSRLAAMVPKGLIREAEALLPQTDDALNAWIINPLARQYFQEAYSALPPAAAGEGGKPSGKLLGPTAMPSDELKRIAANRPDRPVRYPETINFSRIVHGYVTTLSNLIDMMHAATEANREDIFGELKKERVKLIKFSLAAYQDLSAKKWEQATDLLAGFEKYLVDRMAYWTQRISEMEPRRPARPDGCESAA